MKEIPFARNFDINPGNHLLHYCGVKYKLPFLEIISHARIRPFFVWKLILCH